VTAPQASDGPEIASRKHVRSTPRKRAYRCNVAQPEAQLSDIWIQQCTETNK